MKHFFLLGAFLVSLTAFAQAPQQIKYQGVARDAAGAVIANGTITVQFDVHDVTPLGTIIYTETHTGVTTNQFGLFSLSMGSITPFPTNMFGSGNEFLEVSVDFGSGLTSMGTSQFLSVPYALYAETSGSSTPGPQGPTGPQGTAGATGAQGPSGDPGATGAQGPIGNDGPTGPQGAAGAQGPIGNDGPTGPQGPTGVNGAPGPQGPIGPTGAAGTNGTNGATGPQGPIGPTGAAGTNGTTGATGPQGPVGPTGAAGANGTTGATGLTGPVGPTGATGILTNGTVAGNTAYWDGTTWITNSNNIFNNGGNVGMGTTTPYAKLEVAGQMIRTITFATGNGPEEPLDNGQLVSRVLTFTKQSPTSKLRISYTDNFRTAGNGVTNRWEIRVDGASNPGQPLVYDRYVGSSSSLNIHDASTVTGYFQGVTAGTHQIQIWVMAVPGWPLGDAHTGWSNSTWLIEVEEVN